MDKWLKDILPDNDPYHNRGRDKMRKKGGTEFECLCIYVMLQFNSVIEALLFWVRLPNLFIILNMHNDMIDS